MHYNCCPIVKIIAIPIVCNIYVIIINFLVDILFLLANIVTHISVGNGLIMNIPATNGMMCLYHGQNVFFRNFLNFTIYHSSLSMVISCSNEVFAKRKIIISLINAHTDAMSIASANVFSFAIIRSIAVADAEVNP